MIKVEKIYKAYKNFDVLIDVSAQVEKGQIVAVIGPSGCGKSTFLRCINGLEKVSKGRIYVDGKEVTAPDTNLNKIRSEVGIVFQQFNLFPHMSVKENIMLAPVKVKKISKSDADQIAMALLEKVGMLDHAHKYPEQLSGGQAQRVAIARSLAMEPKIMLFDEPTSALDPKMTNEVLDTMKQLAQDGMTMIVVTHEMSFAREVANKIMFFSQSRLIEEAAPDKFFHNPQSEITREFLRSVLKLEV